MPRKAPSAQVIDDEEEDDAPYGMFAESGFYMYYMMPNGYVTASPVGKRRSQYNVYLSQGWKPLDDYGTFQFYPYHTDNPFENLFIRGGAKELPVQQIEEFGLHYKDIKIPRCGQTLNQKTHIKHEPPCWRRAKSVVFPQIEGKNLDGPFYCEKGCSEERDFPTIKALKQHEDIIHKERQASSDITRGLVDGLKEALRANSGNAPSGATGTFLCGVCGAGFDDPELLVEHVGDHTG